MKLPEINITKNAQGEHAWNRVISYACAVVMSMGFLKEVATGKLEWLDYIGYGAGMAIAYSPVLAVKMIAAVKGNVAPPAEPGEGN